MIYVRSFYSKEKLPRKGVIFIGDSEEAANEQLLSRNNIVGVINSAVEFPTITYRIPVSYLRFDLYDYPFQDILGSLPIVYEFLEENLQRGNVLVHCIMGISRSASLVIGYLLLKFSDLSYDHIFKYIKSHRQKINPNRGFRDQLLSLRRVN